MSFIRPLYRGGQLPDARFNPAPAVLKVLARVRVVPAQKGPAHAAVDDVVPRRVGQRDEGAAGAGHVMRANAFVTSLSRHRSSVSASLCRWL